VPSGRPPHFDASVGDVYGRSYGSVRITATSAQDLVDRFLYATGIFLIRLDIAMAIINVFGTALGTVLPDFVTITINVGSESFDSQQAAINAFNSAIAMVRETLKSVAERYVEQRTAARSWDEVNPKGHRFTRYVVQTTVSATFPRTSPHLSDVLAQLSKINNAAFTTNWEVSPLLEKSTKDKLLAEAVVDAQRQAAAIAEAAGEKTIALEVVAEPELFPGGTYGNEIAYRSYKGARLMAAADEAFGSSTTGIDTDLTPEPVDYQIRIAVSYRSK